MRKRHSSNPVIDTHCHIGPNLSGENLLSLMDLGGIDTAVVFPAPSLWSLPTDGNFRNTNDYIARMQEKYPDRFIGFGCINPNLTGDGDGGVNLASRELRRCITELGLRGVKIHPEQHCFTLDALIGSRFMATLQDLQNETGHRIVLISHGMTTFGAMPDQFSRLALRYPDVSIVLAHGAGFQNLCFPSIDPLRDRMNVFADTAMCTIDDSRLKEVTSALGADRILFGSDHFCAGQQNLYGNFLHVLQRALPDPEEQSLVLGGNAVRLLNIR